jgi:NADH dehydrogenase (ubiquinone) Fe-S protein 5
VHTGFKNWKTMTNIIPFLRSPFTDLTGCLVNHQYYGRCEEMEMRVMNCLEAYGLDRGRKKCKNLMEDLQECASRKKQVNYFYIYSVENSGYNYGSAKIS